MTRARIVVAIANPLEEQLVADIRAVDDRLEVRFHPDLLPPPRFPSDHRGVQSFRRTAEREARWKAMLSDAEVLFGLPGDSAGQLADLVRSGAAVRWVQATVGGAGEQVQTAGIDSEVLERVAITRAAGVHAGPLGEFVLMSVLAFTRGMPRLLADQRAHRWGHYPVAELAGRTMLVIGLGSIGIEVSRLATAFGMRVLGVNRTGLADAPYVTEVHPSHALDTLLPLADVVVLALPLTDATRGMFGADPISRLRPDAFFVNVGRGGVVDEEALTDALTHGRLGGAALDVFATEPLGAESPLWDLPNVLVSPHTAALSVRENERIVELFAENLRRYLAGDELIGRVR